MTFNSCNSAIKSLLATMLALVASLLAGPAIAKEPGVAAPPAAEAPTVPEHSPAMWKVADEDTTVYLFGTVHALPKDVEWLNTDIENALGSADQIVTEIKMDDSVGAQMQQLVARTGMLPQDQSLRSLLDDNQRSSFETAMGKLGLPPAAFDRFESWYAGMMMTMLPLLQQGYSPESGVEKVLLSSFEGPERDALETIEFQIGVFDGLPQESQIRFLIETAENIDEVKSTLDAMVVEWLEGDAETLAEMMNEGLTDPTLAEELLYARNRNWARWIDARLDEPGTVFIAVGAGHLAGANSVQDALGDLGITVTRVQ